MSWLKFLLISLLIMAVCLGVFGALLLPALGMRGQLGQMISAGIGGAIVGLLYIKTMKRPDGAR